MSFFVPLLSSICALFSFGEKIGDISTIKIKEDFYFVLSSICALFSFGEKIGCISTIKIKEAFILYCLRFALSLQIVKTRFCLFILFALLLPVYKAKAAIPPDTLRKEVMRRVFSYVATVDTVGLNGHSFHTYTKYMLRTNHRNILLCLVPSMYTVSRDDERDFFYEQFSKVTLLGKKQYQSEPIVELTTIPRRKRAMQHVMAYTIPRVYSSTLFGEHILSPFNKENQLFYKYRLKQLSPDKAEITVKPINDNTQLVKGTAIVEMNTGRILSVHLDGEYDMVRYQLEANMGETGIPSLYPKDCKLDYSFSLLNNKIGGIFHAWFELPNPLPDSIRNSQDTALMTKVRPVPLDYVERKTIERYLEKRQASDSTKQRKKPNKAKEILWDMIGENLLDDIKSNFGKKQQGYFRIKPILNPLYMGYSNSKGFYYKFDARGSYVFDENWQLSLRLKASYIFRWHQLYYRIPMTLNFNKKHNGFLQVEIGNGNRITNNRVLDAIKQQHPDSINWAGLNLEYFKDYNYTAYVHYDFSSRFGMEAGFSYHRRSAVNKQAHTEVGKPTVYRSAAPTLRLIYRPWGYNGMIISADYERSFHNLLNSNMAFERFEFDAQYLLRLKRLNALKMRLGTGFYTSKSGEEYFLDYTNFRDNNIPGGWEDDWSGDFELLDRNWYNASEYYVRGNLTFETPMLAVAWIPLIGRFIERERVYVNALCVEKLHPYAEWGYGFTTRLFSTAMFVAFNQKKFEGFGVKFGFELFRNW